MAAVYEIFREISDKFKDWDGHHLEDNHPVSNVIRWAMYEDGNGTNELNKGIMAENVEYAISALQHAMKLVEGMPVDAPTTDEELADLPILDMDEFYAGGTV